MTPGPVISLYIDDARHACGERTMVVVREGRKLAHLLDPYTLEKLTVPRDRLRYARPSMVDARRMSRRVRETRKKYKRLGLRIPGAFVREALSTLQENVTRT